MRPIITLIIQVLFCSLAHTQYMIHKEVEKYGDQLYPRRERHYKYYNGIKEVKHCFITRFRRKVVTTVWYRDNEIIGQYTPSKHGESWSKITKIGPNEVSEHYVGGGLSSKRVRLKVGKGIEKRIQIHTNEGNRDTIIKLIKNTRDVSWYIRRSKDDCKWELTHLECRISHGKRKTQGKTYLGSPLTSIYDTTYNDDTLITNLQQSVTQGDSAIVTTSKTKYWKTNNKEYEIKRQVSGEYVVKVKMYKRAKYYEIIDEQRSPPVGVYDEQTALSKLYFGGRTINHFDDYGNIIKKVIFNTDMYDERYAHKIITYEYKNY